MPSPFGRFAPDELFFLWIDFCALLCLTFNDLSYIALQLHSNYRWEFSILYIIKLFSLSDTYSQAYCVWKRRELRFFLNNKFTLINFLYINFFPFLTLQQGKLVSDVYIMISVFNYSKKDLFQRHILRLLVKFYKYFPVIINKGNTGSSFQKENSNKENIFFIFL